MYRKKPPALNNLPLHLAKKIVKHVDPMSRKSLRQACISMKTAVDTTPVTYEKLSLTLADKAHAIYIELIIDKENRMEVEFEVMPNGYKVRNPQKNWEKKVRVARKSSEAEPPPFIEAAISHFMRVVRRWTFHVKALVLDFESPETTYLRIQEHQENFQTLLFTKLFRKHQSLILQLMREKLEVLGIPVSVESFRMEFFGCQDDILSVLPFLSPGILKKISFINSGETFEVMETDRFVELRQWREARELSSTYRLKIEPEQWTHFEKVYTKLVYQRDHIQSERMFEICRSNSHWSQFILQDITFSFYDLKRGDPLIREGLERDDHLIISVPDLGYHIDAFGSRTDLFLYRRSHTVAPEKCSNDFEANLTGMPKDVLKKIIEPLDAVSRQSLRLTCKSLKTVADSVPVTYETLLVQLIDEQFTIMLSLDNYNYVQLIFEPDPLGYTIRNPLHNWELTVIKPGGYIDGRKLIEAGAEHLLKLFATKPVLKKLIISVKNQDSLIILNKLFDSMASIPGPWKVQELQVTDSRDFWISYLFVFKGIFAKLEPRTLKTIRLGEKVLDCTFIKIRESEHWRHVEKLVCSCSALVEVWGEVKSYELHLPSISKTVTARLFQTLIESAITQEVTVILQEKLRDSVLTYFKQFEDFAPVDSKTDNSTQLIKVPGTDNQFVSVQLLDFKVNMTKVAL